MVLLSLRHCEYTIALKTWLGWVLPNCRYDLDSRVSGFDIQVCLEGALIIESVLYVKERYKLPWIYDSKLIDVDSGGLRYQCVH